MRKWMSGVSVLVAMLALQSIAPAHAGGVPTYTMLGGASEDGSLYLSGSLTSGDRRCLYGRTVRLQEKVGGSFTTVATDTPKFSPVAGFRIPETANKLRLKVPAKTLSDGTRCAAGKVMPPLPVRVGDAHRETAARGIVSIAPLHVGFTNVGTVAIVGELSGLSLDCRKGRTVKYQVDLGPRWLTISKDVTGANGVYGLGGEFPLADIRVYAPAKTVGDTQCGSLSSGIGL